MDALACRINITSEALGGTGLSTGRMVHANLHPAPLVAMALRRGEGTLSAEGAFVARTGVHTGRSVQDKFVVDEPETRADIAWGKINQKLGPENFSRLADQVRGYLQGQVLFTQDLYAGASPQHRVRVRLVTTNAWHALATSSSARPRKISMISSPTTSSCMRRTLRSIPEAVA